MDVIILKMKLLITKKLLYSYLGFKYLSNQPNNVISVTELNVIYVWAFYISQVTKPTYSQHKLC